VTASGGGRVDDQAHQTGLASMAQMFRRLLEMHGLDAIGIGRNAGVDLAGIPVPGERIELDKIDAILRAAIPLIRDPAFGLRAAHCWHPSELGVLGYAWLSSSTLRTGLERAVRYSRLIGERGITEIEDTRQGLKVRFWAKRGNPAVVPMAAVFVDMTMALLLDMCRMNGGAVLRPVAATLRRQAPDPADAYGRFLGCPVRFGAEENAFVLSARDADRPLPSANRQLAAVFDKMLTEELARIDKSDVVSRTRAAVLEQLSSGEGTAEDTAKQLHMSPRTLQRKLAEVKTTYLQLVDDTRKDLALRYIEDPRRTVTDITFSLGFSQPSAFTRAFKRWTGLSPSDYRAKPPAGPATGRSPTMARQD
jgi:AraC-like DNA-binding protein